MKQRKTRYRVLAWLLSAAMLLSVGIPGEAPVLAAAGDSGITLTVIGDTGNHADNPDEHTGYVYWLKNEPLDINLEELPDDYIAANCGEQILQKLTEAGIDYGSMDAGSCYPWALEKDGVALDRGDGGGWNVIVAYADGSFSSDGWSSYDGAARLQEGCRLIFYWSDGADDCRLSTEDYTTQLNYDTDAVTGISLYKNDEDTSVSEVSCEQGNVWNLKTKLVVPPLSKVSRELTWTSSQPDIVSVEPGEEGAQITAKNIGESTITASMENTLGETISASCKVTVTENTAKGEVATLSGMKASMGADYDGSALLINPEFDPETENYDFLIGTKWIPGDGKAYLWLKPTDPKATVKVVTTLNGEGEAERSAETAAGEEGYLRYQVPAGEADGDLTEVSITVTSEDGKNTRKYLANLGIMEYGPDLSYGQNPLSARGKDSVDLTFRSTAQGFLYYQITTGDQQAPTVDEMLAGASSVPVSTGTNMVTIQGVPEGEAKLYVLLTDYAQNIMESAGNWNPESSVPPCIEVASFASFVDVTLDQEKLIMETGASTTLNAVLAPEGNTDPVTWESSNPSAVKVEGNGTAAVVTALGNSGDTAVITAKVGEATDTCTVTLTKLNGISLNQASLDMQTEDTADLTVTLNADGVVEGDEVIWNSEIIWETNDPQVAAIKANGTHAVVTAAGAGEAEITVRKGSFEANCSVWVMRRPLMLKSLVFSQSSGGSTIFGMTEIDPDTKECTVKIPDNTNMVYVKPTLDGSVTGAASITAKFTNASTGADEEVDLPNNMATGLNNKLLKSYNWDKREVTIEVTADGRTETYHVHVVRTTSMKGLEVTDDNGKVLEYSPKFSGKTITYSISIPANVKSIQMKLTPEYSKNTDITVNGETAPDGLYTLALTGQDMEVTMSAGNPGSADDEPIVYTLKIKMLPVYRLTVKIDPADAVVAIYSPDQERVKEKDGVYELVGGKKYTYTIGKLGYKSASGDVTLAADEEKTITLEKAPESTLEPVDSEWGGYWKTSDNQNIVEAAPPTDTSTAEIKWDVQYGKNAASANSISDVILVDGKLCGFYGDQLVLLDKTTGEIKKNVTMAAAGNSTDGKPLYAAGMIFVPLNSGKVQAFNAKTLESLWVYTGESGSYSKSAIRYDSGYLYIGFSDSSKHGKFVCLTTTDEDPSDPLEAKTELWSQYSGAGYKYTSCYTTEKYVIIGSPDSILYCLDKVTGEEVQRIALEEGVGGVSTGISYSNGRIYFGTVRGWLYSYQLNADGTVDVSSKNSLQIAKITSDSYPLYSTPLVYKNRIYMGVRQSVPGNSYGISVISEDAATGALSCAYVVKTDNQPKAAGTLAVSEGADGYVYVYFTDDSTYGRVYVVKDRGDLTEADAASGVLYDPGVTNCYGKSQVTMDEEGNLYFRYQNAHIVAIGRNSVYLNQVTFEGGNPVVDGGAEFNPQQKEHKVLVDPGTDLVRINVDASAGTTVTVNGTDGASQDVALTDGTGEATVVLTDGTNTRTYVFAIRQRKQDADLRALDASWGSGTEYPLYLTPAFDPSVYEYSSSYYNSYQAQLNVWLAASDEDATVTVTALSGVKNSPEGTVITGSSGTHNGETMMRYRASFENVSSTPVQVKITVTAEDGTTAKEYVVSCAYDTAQPVLTLGDTPLSNRTEESVDLTLNASMDGYLYYIVNVNDEFDEGVMPNVMDFNAKGQSVPVKAGEGTVTLTGIPQDYAGNIYIRVEGINQNWSSPTETIAVEAAPTVIPGDLNGDGKVTATDAVQLLQKLADDEGVDPAAGDINGDGKVTTTDAVSLLQMIADQE